MGPLQHCGNGTRSSSIKLAAHVDYFSSAPHPQGDSWQTLRCDRCRCSSMLLSWLCPSCSVLIANFQKMAEGVTAVDTAKRKIVPQAVLAV